MSTIENSEIRALDTAEVDEVFGGFIFASLGVFLVGAAVGYGLRLAGEWTVGQLLDEIDAG